ncbi:MAG: M16 family metallopeptidase [Chloroflexota bacterium]
MSSPTALFQQRSFKAMCLAAACTLAATISSSEVPAVHADSMVESSVLPNGLTLITERRPESRVAGIALVVRAGSRYEDDTTDSAAKMLERMYLQGTVTRPSRDELIKPITRLGSDLGVSAGFESVLFQTSVRIADVDVALDVLSDALLRSQFDEFKFDKERDLAVQELVELQDQPPALAGYTFQRTIFAGQSMGRVPRGTIEGLNALTPDALDAFRNTFVGANRASIVLVSPYAHADVHARVTAMFGGFGTVPERTSDPTNFERSATGRTEIVAGSDQATVLVGTATPGAQHLDRAPLTILVSALNGFTGRLMHEIRDIRGLAYGTSASTRSASDSGTLVAQAGTEPTSAEEVMMLLEEQLHLLAELPLTDDELKRAIGQAIGQRLLDNESALARASEIAGLWAVGVQESVEDFEARLQSVTAEDVQRVARTYLGSDRLLRLVTRP